MFTATCRYLQLVALCGFFLNVCVLLSHLRLDTWRQAASPWQRCRTLQIRQRTRRRVHIYGLTVTFAWTGGTGAEMAAPADHAEQTEERCKRQATHWTIVVATRDRGHIADESCGPRARSSSSGALSMLNPDFKAMDAAFFHGVIKWNPWRGHMGSRYGGLGAGLVAREAFMT